MLLRLYYNLNKDECTLVSALLIKLLRVYRNNGFTYFVKYVKATRLCFTRYISGKPIYINKDRVSLINGVPKTILPFIKGIDEFRYIRIVLSILNISKAVKTPKGVICADYSTIISPNKRNFYTIPALVIKDFIDKYKLNMKKPKYHLKDYYFSMKIGPQGPSLISSWVSTKLLPSTLFISINNMMGTYKGYFMKFQNTLYLDEKSIPTDTRCAAHRVQHTSVGRIAILEAPEGKARIVAMIDYYSQFVLKAIHKQIFGLFQRFAQDRTFSQDPRGLIKEDGHSFHSFDLSAATDRLPILIQQKLLSYIYDDSNYGKDWANLLVNRDYITPEGELIRYKIGTPMGGYTS